ncbi:MAG: Cof-type HAD-IIB family hydrolase [Erysipelotrichaceae bacterium]|nr:Cof-type HAD-IIB family hydrolase [Erysipelotrichaceae bacterium]
MKKIYFASDIDGTLSMEGKPLNIEQRILLKKMHDSGIHIIFATGRDYKKLHEVLEKLDFEYAAICCNGAEIYDSLGNLKFYNILNQNVQSDILHYLEKQDVLYIVYTQKVNFVRKTVDKNARLLRLGETAGKEFEAAVEEAKIYNRLIYQNTVEQDQLVSMDMEVMKIEVIDERIEKLNELKAFIEANFSVSVQSSFPYNLEIAPLQNNKGNAIEKVVEKDAVIIAAGDGMNDLSLFQKSDIKIAMPHAVSELKKLATHILGENDDLLEFVGGIINEINRT